MTFINRNQIILLLSFIFLLGISYILSISFGENLAREKKISKEIMDKDIDDIYFGNIGLAMSQQNHNDLYTKLFRN